MADTLTASYSPALYPHAPPQSGIRQTFARLFAYCMLLLFALSRVGPTLMPRQHLLRAMGQGPAFWRILLAGRRPQCRRGIVQGRPTGDRQFSTRSSKLPNGVHADATAGNQAADYGVLVGSSAS